MYNKHEHVVKEIVNVDVVGNNRGLIKNDKKIL